MIRSLLRVGNALRDVPIALRYIVATGIVLGVLALRTALHQYIPGLPYLLFFPAIWLCACILDHGTGVYATLLSAALAAFFFLPPENSIWIQDVQSAVGLVLFIIISLGGAAFIEVLRNALLALDSAEREKDMLLQEVNHRIRNDLQLLSSVTRIRSRAFPDNPTCGRELNESADRTRVLGRMYSRLERVEGTTEAEIDACDYISDLCSDLQTTVVDVRPIEIRVEAESVPVTHQRAVSIGLILNELITNALKHGFPDARSGRIEVTFHREPLGELVLKVADNGIGTATQKTGPGLGKGIVEQLARQLGGTVERQVSAGTTCILRFPEVAMA